MLISPKTTERSDHQNDETEDKRHPAHLQEIGLLDRLHTDVVIEVVDLDQMLAVESAALDFVAVNIEIEAVGILRRDQVHFPEWEKERHRNRDRGGEQAAGATRDSAACARNRNSRRSRLEMFQLSFRAFR